MKKIVLACIVLTSFVLTAQTNKEIAGVYIKKAEKKLQNLEYEDALKNFNRAVKYLDTISDYKVAELGMLINYDLSNYRDAKKYANQYFLLTKKVKPKSYQDNLELTVNISEKIEELEIEEKRIEEERIKKEKELKRIDSLKTVWKTNSDALSIQADSIYKFNKDKVGLYQKNEFFGIITDKGEIILKADNYKHSIVFDSYILLLDKKLEPTKIYCFNSKTKKGFKLPPVSDFNPTSTNYGKVMLPRGNGRIVMYPNNYLKTVVFDIPEKKIVKISNEKELFRALKKTDAISKFNKDGEVKIKKEWYSFGGHLGGGIYSLYNKDYSIHGFLFSTNGDNVISGIKNMGYFYNAAAQAVKDGKIIWVNTNGNATKAPKDESGVYNGSSKVVRNEDGKYQFFQKIEGKDYIILGNKKLEKMVDFLRSNSEK